MLIYKQARYAKKVLQVSISLRTPTFKNDDYSDDNILPYKTTFNVDSNINQYKAWGLQEYYKKDSGTGVSLWVL